MAFKRKRSENFSTHDKELLIECVLRRKDIVENKKTDAVSMEAKNKAWLQITKDYNPHTATPRSTSSLRTCWDNMKRMYRRKKEEKLNIIKKGLNNSNILLEMDIEKSSDSEDLQEEDTRVQPTHISSQWRRSLVKMADVLNSVNSESVEERVIRKSSKPHVHVLNARETAAEEEEEEEEEEEVLSDSKPILLTPYRKENSPSRDANCSRSNRRWTSRKQNQQVNNSADTLVESKLELARLAKEHAIADEKRRIELHELQVQKTKLKIEILKLELTQKQAAHISNL